jgi:hypothetical protein
VSIKFSQGAVGTLGSLFHRKISANDFDHPVVKVRFRVRVSCGWNSGSPLLEAAQDVDKEQCA